MIIIAHRANNESKRFTENSFGAILSSLLLGFHLELDIWYINDDFYLGHDDGIYKIEKRELLEINFEFGNRIFWHAKNIETLKEIIKEKVLFINSDYFFHQSDDCTLTSKNIIWTYPGRELYENSIAVMPENVSSDYERYVQDLFLNNQIIGVCTDYPLKWNKLKKGKENEKQND